MTGAEVFGRVFDAGRTRYWDEVRASKGGILRASKERMGIAARASDAAGRNQPRERKGSLV